MTDQTKDAFGRNPEQHKAAKDRRHAQWQLGHAHYVQNTRPRLLSMRRTARADLAHYKPMERGDFARSPFRDIVKSLNDLVTAINHYDAGMNDPDGMHIGDVAAHSKQMFDYLDANGLR